MRKCDVVGCNSKLSPYLSLFRVPESIKREEWIDFLIKTGKIIRPEKLYRICELHFEAHEIADLTRRRELIRGAVPTLDNAHKRVHLPKLRPNQSQDFSPVEAKKVKKNDDDELFAFENGFKLIEINPNLKKISAGSSGVQLQFSQRENTPKGYKMRVCSVPNCNSKQSSKLSLFKVPPNGLNRNKWKDFLTKCGVSFWDDQRDYRVCERHFQSYEVVDMDHRRQLVRGSYPTLDNNNKRLTELKEKPNRSMTKANSPEMEIEIIDNDEDNSNEDENLSDLLEYFSVNSQNISTPTTDPFKVVATNMSKKVCSVPNCGSRHDPCMSLFKLPSYDPARSEWINFLEQNGKEIGSIKQLQICELHFEAHLISDKEHRREIVRGAIPTLDNYNKRVHVPVERPKYKSNPLKLNETPKFRRTMPLTDTSVIKLVCKVPCNYDDNNSEPDNAKGLSTTLDSNPPETPIPEDDPCGICLPNKIMIESEFEDSDGYKLRFEEDCSESDKKIFRQKYLSVDNVQNERLHCTTCDIHIGTAPIAEKVLRTHQVLAVSQCNKCHAFYNSGEFGKGEDGSEYYCRWCGQGGEVYCCATCPFVFCKKCIKSNLSNSYVREIERNDDWACFVCDKTVLKHLRAKHWALRNFMTKQLEKIQVTPVDNEEELSEMLNDDASKCCPRTKRKTTTSLTVAAPFKRASTTPIVQPPAKKQHIVQPTKVLPPRTFTQRQTFNSQSSIVCTPDISELLNPSQSTASTSQSPQVSTPPPPLAALQKNRVNIPSPAPVFHNVNGFQIDLNHAARQEIFRLPNGKLIQVRKQPTTPPANAPRPVAIAPKPTLQSQYTIRQGTSIRIPQPNIPIRMPPTTSLLNNINRGIRPQVNPRIRAPAVPYFPAGRPSLLNGRGNNTQQNIQTAFASQPARAAPKVLNAPTSTIFTQQNGTISVARAPQPDTPFGKAKIDFEDKIISGLEICQHTINKMITLTNSSSFKESRTFSDLQGLHIHLMYLFNFTSEKIKLLQEDIVIGKEKMEAINKEEKKNSEVDELEIVEEKADVIEVMSDDDEPEVSVAQKIPTKIEVISPVVAATAPPIKKPILKHIQYTRKDKSDDSVVSANGQKETTKENSTSLFCNEKLAAASEMATINFDQLDSLMASNDLVKEILENDKKLGKKVVVKVEKLEDTKNKVVLQYMKKYQERIDESSATLSSREGTPELLMNVDVVIEDDEDIELNNAVSSIGGIAEHDSEKENSVVSLNDEQMDVSVVEPVKNKENEDIVKLVESEKDKENGNTEKSNDETETAAIKRPVVNILKIDEKLPDHLMDFSDNEQKGSDNEVTEPEDVETEFAKPDEVAEPKEVTAPENFSESKEVAEPKEVTEPENFSESKEVAEDEKVSETEEVTESKEVVEPNEAAKDPIEETAEQGDIEKSDKPDEVREKVEEDSSSIESDPLEQGKEEQTDEVSSDDVEKSAAVENSFDVTTISDQSVEELDTTEDKPDKSVPEETPDADVTEASDPLEGVASNTQVNGTENEEFYSCLDAALSREISELQTSGVDALSVTKFPSTDEIVSGDNVPSDILSDESIMEID